VLGSGPSGGAGFGSRASLVTSFAEGGRMCWSSSGDRSAAGSGRVSSERARSRGGE
jgi:hypothetical protein